MTIRKKRVAKKIAWVLMGIILLELLLRTAGAAYLFVREHSGELPKDNTEDVYSLLCLGESTTALGGVYSWPSQLETILNERSPGKRFTVINEGLVGTNTAVILSRLEMNLEKYNPDMVITMMGRNDEKRLYVIYENASMTERNDEIMSVEYGNTLESRIIAKLDGLRICQLGRLLWAALTNPSETAGSQEETQLRDREGALKEAIQADPDKSDAYVDLGGVYYNLGALLDDASLLEEAEQMFRKAIGLGVLDGRIYDGLGMSYEARGMYREAIETYEQLLELSEAGKIDNGLDEQTYTKLGWHYFMGRQPKSKSGEQCAATHLEKAEEMFQKALEINSNNGGAYSGLGWVYFEQCTSPEGPSLLEEAERLFRKAVELENPYESRIGYTTYEGLAMTYEAQGRYQEAIETYERVIELSQTGPMDTRVVGWAYARLGWLYHEVGVPDEKIEEFYGKAGILFEVARNTTAYGITKHHYRELYRVLDKRGIPLVAVQYPTQSVDDLKQMFSEDDDVIFVSNEENFRQALNEGSYGDYFVDRCYDDFGHGTPEGNRLIAESVADVVLIELGTSCDMLGSSSERDVCYWQRFLEKRRDDILSESPSEYCFQMDSPTMQYICLRTMFRPHMIAFASLLIPFASLGNASAVLSEIPESAEEYSTRVGYVSKHRILRHVALLAASNYSQSQNICNSMDEASLKGECIFHLAVARVMGTESSDLVEEAASLAELCDSVSDRDWRAECYYLLADELALLRPVPDLKDIVEYCRQSLEAADYGCYLHVTNLLPAEEAVSYCSLLDDVHQPRCAWAAGRNMETGLIANFTVRGEKCYLFPSSLVHSCLTGVAQELGGACTKNISHSILFCEELPAPYVGECVTGASRTHVVLQNMVDFSPAIEGCKEYPSELQEFCFNHIITDLIDTVNLSRRGLVRREPSEARAWCGKLPSSYEERCLEGLPGE